MEARAKIGDENLRRYIGYNIKRAFNVMQADLNSTLKPLDLRMITYSALAIIVGNPGLRPSELAEALSIERANLAVILGELEQAGLIERCTSPTDRRAQSISISDAGEALFRKASVAVDAHDQRMIASLSPSELAQLRLALKRIEEARP